MEYEYQAVEFKYYGYGKNDCWGFECCNFLCDPCIELHNSFVGKHTANTSWLGINRKQRRLFMEHPEGFLYDMKREKYLDDPYTLRILKVKALGEW